MKTILILILSISFAQANRIPISEARRYIEASPNGVTALFTCEQKPQEQCLDFSHIESWETAEIVDNLVDDHERPHWSSPFEEEVCEGKDDCETKLLAKFCKEGSKFINENYNQIYCIKILSYDKKVQGKKLVNNPDRLKALKDSKKAADDARKLRKSNAKTILKNAELDKVQTIKEMKVILKEILEVLSED